MIWRELPPTAGLPLQWSDFTQSPADSLENLLAKFLGVSQVKITSSGTAALVVALETLKRLEQSKQPHGSEVEVLSGRTEVIIPGYSCPLVVHAAHRVGLSIVLCDTQAGNFDFDFEQLQRLCTDRTLAIIPTHLGGIAADVDRCKSIAKSKGAYVVEDAAQALGTKLNGRYAGTIGDIGMFSLTVGKGLSIYEGGFIVCEDQGLRELLGETMEQMVHPDTYGERQKIAELVGLWALYNPIGLHLVYGRDLRHWLKSNDPQRAVGDVFEDDIELHQVGNMRKKVGANAFARLRAFLESNAARGMERAAKLSQLDTLTVLGTHKADSDLYTFPFLFVLTGSMDSTRTVMEKLWTKGLGVTKLFYRCLADDPHLRPLVAESSTPNARDFAARVFTITNSQMMKDSDFEQIHNTIAGIVCGT